MAFVIAGWALTVVGFLAYIRDLQQRADRRTDGLLNRIQAPARAVTDSLAPAEPTESPLHVTYDDDKSYWDARKGLLT